MFPLPRGWLAQDTPRREHGHGLSSGQDTAPHSHPSSCLEATRRDQARSSRLSSGTSPLHIPLQGCPTGHLHPAMQKITPVRMKGPCTDSGASRRACLEILNVSFHHFPQTASVTLISSAVPFIHLPPHLTHLLRGENNSSPRRSRQRRPHAAARGANVAQCPCLSPPVATVTVGTHRHTGTPSQRHHVPPLEEDDQMPPLKA